MMDTVDELFAAGAREWAEAAPGPVRFFKGDKELPAWHPPIIEPT